MVSPEISVVICHKTGDFIYGCVESVQASYGVNFEIFIISSDPGLHIPGCRIYHSDESPAKKRNWASSLADGEYICFLDDDVTINPDTLRHLRNTLRKPYVGMVFGKLWNMQYRNLLDDAGSYLTKTGFLWSRAGQLLEDKGQFNRETRVLSGKSACCMIKSYIFNSIGGFDEDFGILAEETLISWQVWLLGFDVMYNPKATGWHAFKTTLKPINKHYSIERVNYNGSRNYLSMLTICLEKKNLWKILPLHYFIWFSAGLSMILSGKIKQGWSIFRGIWYTISHHNLLIQKRNKTQNMRLISDRELFPIILRKPPQGYYINRFLQYLKIGLHG